MTSPETAMGGLAPITSEQALFEIIGHLGAAVSQSLPSDDQTIMEHVRAALDMAHLLWRAQK